MQPSISKITPPTTPPAIAPVWLGVDCLVVQLVELAIELGRLVVESIRLAVESVRLAVEPVEEVESGTVYLFEIYGESL